MKLVVDTNILVSFFRDCPVRFIIINPFLFDLRLYVPEYSFKELSAIKPIISKYSKLSKNQIDISFKKLSKYIEIIPSEAFKSFKENALKLAPHEKDVSFFALAMKLNCAVWSNELAFK